MSATLVTLETAGKGTVDVDDVSSSSSSSFFFSFSFFFSTTILSLVTLAFDADFADTVAFDAGCDSDAGGFEYG
jgi:hypothetical protein